MSHYEFYCNIRFVTGNDGCHHNIFIRCVQIRTTSKIKRVSSLLKISESIEKFVSKQTPNWFYINGITPRFILTPFPTGDITLNDITVSDEMLGYALRPHSKAPILLCLRHTCAKYLTPTFYRTRKVLLLYKNRRFCCWFSKAVYWLLRRYSGYYESFKIRKTKSTYSASTIIWPATFRLTSLNLYQKFGHENTIQDLPYQNLKITTAGWITLIRKSRKLKTKTVIINQNRNPALKTKRYRY